VQPDPTERLVTLDFRHKQHGATRLHVELLGRAANLILTRENGIILEALVRVPGDAGARRVLLPGRPYLPPPLAARHSPLQPAEALAASLSPLLGTPGPLWKSVAGRVAGVGPDQAREVVRRAALQLECAPDAPALRSPAGAQAIALALTELWSAVQTGAWEPCLWIDTEGRPVGFSPWRPQPGPGAPAFVSRPLLSDALEELAAARTWAAIAVSVPALRVDAYAAQRASVAQRLRAARARLLRALDALAADEPPPGAAAEARTQAEWLLALHTTLAPDATHLQLSSEQTGGPALDIKLDPTRTPVEQAEALFKRAAKLERAAIFIPTRRARLTNDLAFLSDLVAELAQAENQPEIAAIRVALEKSGLSASRPTAADRRERGRLSGVGQPRRFVADDGCIILVGRNARLNDHLTFEIAGPGDLWLHVRGAPGAHAVVLGHGREPSDATVEAAARLAGFHSSLRGERAVDVILAERRHVSRLPGGHPGQVLVRNERVLRVPAEAPAHLHEESGERRPAR
jgi:predicted ribosome quality control (RQC) complex YloA/Tae2 family protein